MRAHYPLIGAFIFLLSLSACSTDSALEPASSSTTDGEILGKGGPSVDPVTTSTPKYLTSRSGTVPGSVNSGGNGIVERGVCYATTTTPTVANAVVTNGSGEGAFECALLGLDDNTTYYARAFSKDRKGNIKYGSQVSFSTKVDFGTITDADGNEYETVTIGDQVWTIANLRTTKYADGTSIPNITDDADWATATEGAYCDQDNDADNAATYGRLYNFHAVSDSRSLAPDGWHVPSMADWQTLKNYLGGESYAGGRIKTVGTTYWSSPNEGATNAASFFAISSGYRSGFPDAAAGPTSNFAGPGVKAIFWTSTEEPWSDGVSRPRKIQTDCYGTSLYTYGDDAGRRVQGYSVRLVKD